MDYIVITGAARNIGKGIAEVLLSQNYKCILIDIDGDELHKTVNALGSACKEYVADIGDINQVEQFFKWIKQENYTVGALINNAGYDANKSVLEIEADDLAQSNRTNLQGPFYMSSRIAKHWVNDRYKGNIIFISSTHSTVTRTHPLYSASKAAIEMFAKEGALELAEFGIRVNCVAPGVVLDNDSPGSNNLIPLGFNQTPKDIGETVSFLLSDKAKNITGQTLVVDGGFSLAHTHYWLKNKKL